MPFADEPAVCCGGGWWRIASPARRLWHADTPLRCRVDGNETVAAETVWVAGQARIPGSDHARDVRLDGAFLPLAELVEAERWRMDVELASPAATFGGTRGPSKPTGATVALQGLQGTLERSVGPFLVSLDTNTGGYHAVAGTAIPDGDVLRVTVDPNTLRHADGRARP